MTARREVPFAADSLAWVHNELAEIKSKLNLIQQTADQSRGLAADAVEKSHQVRARTDQLDGLDTELGHLQNDALRVREQLVRAQEDIHSLRQSREEQERRTLADAERVRQDRNDLTKRFADVERQIDAWQERVAGTDEHSRRNLEGIAQLIQRMDAIEAQLAETDTLQSRILGTVSRIDQDIQRVPSALVEMEREDDVHRERAAAILEALRRLEGEVEGLRSETNKISRIDDRLELVQAERTRHNERLNEITAEMTKVGGAINEHSERLSLIEVRISGYQDDLRGLKERLQLDRDRISAHLHALTELEAGMRKREISGLEKEIRDIRGRVINFGDK